MRILDKYSKKLPDEAKSADNTYLTPVTVLPSDPAKSWFTKMPVGRNALSKMLKMMCLEAGLPDIYTNHIPYNGLFSKEFYFRIIRRGGLLQKLNSSNNMKPTTNSNHICEISWDDSRVWLSWHCIAISRFQQISRIPTVHLILNTVPPEVIKVANKIVKQASDKSGTLKTQQRKYSVSRLQSNASLNSSVGAGVSLWIRCCFTACDCHLGLVRIKVNFNTSSSMRAVKISCCKHVYENKIFEI